MSTEGAKTQMGITDVFRDAKSVTQKLDQKRSEELHRLWPNSGEVSVMDDLKCAGSKKTIEPVCEGCIKGLENKP